MVSILYQYKILLFGRKFITCDDLFLEIALFTTGQNFKLFLMESIYRQQTKVTIHVLDVADNIVGKGEEILVMSIFLFSDGFLLRVIKTLNYYTVLTFKEAF